MSYIFGLIGAGIIGVCVALEPTVNSALGKTITPRLATLHSFVVGILVMILISAVNGGFKEYKMITKAPPYLWFGGLLGVTIVYLGARVAPVIGIASMVTIMVAVQLVTGVLIDTAGLFGAEKVPLSAGRIIGMLLLAAGARLIVR